MTTVAKQGDTLVEQVATAVIGRFCDPNFLEAIRTRPETIFHDGSVDIANGTPPVPVRFSIRMSRTPEDTAPKGAVETMIEATTVGALPDAVRDSAVRHLAETVSTIRGSIEVAVKPLSGAMRSDQVVPPGGKYQMSDHRTGRVVQRLAFSAPHIAQMAEIAAMTAARAAVDAMKRDGVSPSGNVRAITGRPAKPPSPFTDL